MVLSHRIPRTLRKNAGVYLGLVLLLALSSGIMFGLGVATKSTKANVEAARISFGVEDARFETLEPLSASQIRDLKRQFEVSIAENLQRDVDLKEAGATLRLMPIPQDLNRAEALSGRLPENSGEIAVDRAFATAHKLAPDDMLDVNGREMRLVGTYVTPDALSVRRSDTDLFPDGSSFGLGIVTPSQFAGEWEPGAQRSYSVRFSLDNEEEFREALISNASVLRWTEQADNPRITTFDGEVDAWVSISVIAPIFIMLVTAVIIAAVQARILQKESRSIGTLSALGYRKGELYRHYLSIPAILSVVGALLGLVVGGLAIAPFAELLTEEYNTPPFAAVITPIDVVLPLLVPLLFVLALCARSISRVLDRNIPLLLKGGTAATGNQWLVQLVSSSFPFTTRFRLRELASGASRSALMVIGVVAASLFSISGAIFSAAFDGIDDANPAEVFGYENQYFYNSLQVEPPSQGEPFLMGHFSAPDESGAEVSIVLQGVPSDAEIIQLVDREGKPIATDATAVSAAAARRMGWQIGDQVTATNDATLTEIDFTVDAIADLKTGGTVYLPQEDLAEALDLPVAAHQGVYSRIPLDLPEDQVSSVLTSEDTATGMESMVGAVRAMLLIMSTVAAVLAVVIVYVLTSVTVEDYRRTLSTLKVLGYHDRETSSLLLGGNVFLVVVGFLVAIPLSWLATQALFDEVTAGMFFILEPRLYWWHLVLSAALILLSYWGALVLVQRKVRAVNMAESLKAEE